MSQIQKAITGLFLVSVVVFLYLYIQGYDSSIGWNVTTSAESSSFYTLPFKKGPFQFSFEANRYELAETFSAGPIERHSSIEMSITLVLLVGLCILLAAATFLPNFWFLGVMGLFIFFVISLHMPEVGLFGLNSDASWSSIILMVAYLLPSYYFHAFKTDVKLLWRILSLVLVTILVILFSGIDALQLHDQFVTGSYYGMTVLGLLFLILIAEELVFSILYLITKSKGGQNNHVHFSVFSAAYLGILITYYGNMAHFWKIDLPYFDPFVLLAISSVVAIWSIQYKSSLFQNLINVTQARIILSALGITVLAFLSQSMFQGNDPAYEGFHYFIIYTQLGFGVMFFLYLIWNFISPLGQGLQVYKIAYIPKTLPYETIRIVGLVAVAGFFFLARKEPFLLFQSGHYNYIGSQQEAQNHIALADEYYREGSIFGSNNHYSNYKLGYHELQKDNIKAANYYFRKATRRFPSPQSYINTAGTFAMLGETTPSMATMKEGLVKFPHNNQLLNNLGLTYIDLEKLPDAVSVLAEAKPDSKWTNASLVNLWKVVVPDSAVAEEDFDRGNLAVKTNVLSNLIHGQMPANVKFDTADLYPSFPLHLQTYLINASLYFDNEDIPEQLEKSLAGQLDESIYFNGRNSKVLSYYKNGQINRALQELDFLVADVPTRMQSKYLNQMGMIALSQHAPSLASDFFKKAADKGHQDAFTNQLVCFLEQGQFEAAENWVNYLVKLDTGFTRLKNDIANLKLREGLNQDQQLFRLYYKYQGYSPAEINALLNQADQSFAESLWMKVSREQLIAGDIEKLETYRAVFNSFLSKKDFEEADILMTLANDEKPKGNSPLAKALNMKDEEKKAQVLSQIAGANALNEPLVLAVSKILASINPTAAYEVLVKSIDINSKSVALHKQFALTALETGLVNYAEDGLQKLATITTQQDYQEFARRFEARKAELDAESGW